MTESAAISERRLYWSRRGDVACEHHAPPHESDRWRSEGWEMIQLPRFRESKYQCGVCWATPIHRGMRKPQDGP